MQFYKVWQEPSLIRFGLTHPTQLSIVWLSCLIRSVIIKPYNYVLDVFWLQSLHFCWHYFLSSFSPISLHGTTFILSPRAKLSALHTCAQGRGCCTDLFRPSLSPPLSRPNLLIIPPPNGSRKVILSPLSNLGLHMYGVLFVPEVMLLLAPIPYILHRRTKKYAAFSISFFRLVVVLLLYLSIILAHTQGQKV